MAHRQGSRYTGISVSGALSIFGNQLQDEQYLQEFGLRQGRFDFAVTNLGLIVEVKVVRTSNDVYDLEAQIADDLKQYFKEENPFESIVPI